MTAHPDEATGAGNDAPTRDTRRAQTTSPTDEHGRRQIVGVDGSLGSEAALSWAIAHQTDLGTVQPVVAWTQPWWTVSPLPGAALPVPDVDVANVARNQAMDSIRRAAAAAGADVAEPVVVQSSPGPALVDLGSPGRTIVIGTRGHGTVVSGILGSVSAYVAGHASCPVVIVPVPDSGEVGPTDPSQRIVVGIDGSDNASAALDWAVEHAPEGATIRIIRCWGLTYAAEAAAAGVDLQIFEQQATEDAQRAVEKVSERAGQRGLSIETDTPFGDPRAVIRDACTQAELLVVGSRGHRGIAHLLLGSVASALVHHPTVPTVVVPA